MDVQNKTVVKSYSICWGRQKRDLYISLCKRNRIKLFYFLAQPICYYRPKFGQAVLQLHSEHYLLIVELFLLCFKQLVRTQTALLHCSPNAYALI